MKMKILQSDQCASIRAVETELYSLLGSLFKHVKNGIIKGTQNSP